MTLCKRRLEFFRKHAFISNDCDDSQCLVLSLPLECTKPCIVVICQGYRMSTSRRNFLLSATQTLAN